MLDSMMELSNAVQLGWRFPGLRRLKSGNYPELVPCSRCGHPVSRALDPRGNLLGVEFTRDGAVEVHACLGAELESRADSGPGAILTVFGPLALQESR